MESGELQGALATLTQNPALMEKLRELAGGLSLPASTQTADTPVASSVPQPRDTGGSARRKLLAALRPYLQEKRRARLDEMLGLLALFETAESSGLLSGFLQNFQTTKERQGTTEDVSSQ